jgi:hypothetical protein
MGAAGGRPPVWAETERERRQWLAGKGRAVVSPWGPSLANVQQNLLPKGTLNGDFKEGSRVWWWQRVWPLR